MSCLISCTKMKNHFVDITKVPLRSTQLLAHSSAAIHGYSDGGKPGILPTPRSEGDILSSPHLKAFTFKDLRNATKNFSNDYLIGQGGFGYVYKGWIDGHSLSAAKPGSGTAVAVKKLKPEGFQGHKEWLVGLAFTFAVIL
jgi:interleukin-1 receptor-associated kinase 4